MSISIKSTETFTLYSNDLGGQFDLNQAFNDWGHNGHNISPHLRWDNVPDGTKSFAITMYDIDAPSGSGWWHWLAFNIPPNLTEFEANAGDVSQPLLPDTVVQSVNDYGTKGYGGPCPPKGHGFHQYMITIHALSVEKLDLSEDTNPPVVGFNILANTIEKASLVAYYKIDE